MSDRDVLPRAMEAMHTTKTAQELRQAQAAVLTLLLDLSLPQTAQGLGMCPTWVCVLRRRFAKVAKGGSHADAAARRQAASESERRAGTGVS